MGERESEALLTQRYEFEHQWALSSKPYLDLGIGFQPTTAPYPAQDDLEDAFRSDLPETPMYSTSPQSKLHAMLSIQCRQPTMRKWLFKKNSATSTRSDQEYKMGLDYTREVGRSKKS